MCLIIGAKYGLLTPKICIVYRINYAESSRTGRLGHMTIGCSFHVIREDDFCDSRFIQFAKKNAREIPKNKRPSSVIQIL